MVYSHIQGLMPVLCTLCHGYQNQSQNRFHVINVSKMFVTVPLTFSFAQLAKGKSLGRSKPATKSQIQAQATHCVDYFYYIQALLNCLL